MAVKLFQDIFARRKIERTGIKNQDIDPSTPIERIVVIIPIERIETIPSIECVSAIVPMG